MLTSISLTFNILVAQKIFEVITASALEERQIERASQIVEAEDHIEIMEKLKKDAEADKNRPTATDFDLLEDKECFAIVSHHQEFEKARLKRNIEKKNGAMTALFLDIDNWFEETINASLQSHKAALIKTYDRIIRFYVEGLVKEGIHDMELQASDSHGTKLFKTIIKYDGAKASILKAKTEADRESAIMLALKYRETVKDHVRALSHDEL